VADLRGDAPFIAVAGRSRSTSPKPWGRFRSSCSSLIAMPFAIALPMPGIRKGHVMSKREMMPTTYSVHRIAR